MNPKTFADEIEDAAAGENIEAILVAKVDSSWWGAEPDPRFVSANAISGQLMSWSEMRPKLDYSYNSGFGGADCHAFTAWTASRVLFVHEYDGATGVVWVPRHPVVHEPNMSGIYP